MASSSTGAVGGATYQVFLSFRGPDTRQGFTDVLYHALLDAGIRVFRDNEEIRKGEEIGGEIMRAIQESRIFVPIFSRGYAASKWCLLELTEMVESMEGSSGKKILPVFYDVRVDDVKLKTELYSKALKEHSAKSGPGTAKQWEEALRIAGKIKGWELKDTGHGEFVRLFVRHVSMNLKVKQKCVTEYFVRRDYQVEALMNLLDLESSGVRIVGIYGMGGMGKTTLAKVVFNELCDRFDCCSFLADVRESSRQHRGIEQLQKQLLDSLGLRSGGIMDVDDGITRMREMLVRKKVLIVLDDVDHRKQIHGLAGDVRWFGSGSRIIITTRDQGVLGTNQQSIQTLEIEEMKPEEARRLLCMHAFLMDSPPSDYLSLSDEAVACTGRLPLALEVIGSYLRDKPSQDWVGTIDRLKRVPHRDVQEKLMISYEALNPRTKQIFLDIACFFINHEKTYPVYMWQACDFDPEMGLRELIDLSLVKIIDKEDKYLMEIKKEVLWMHDQLRDLGRKIVRDESFITGVNSSRLWLPEDVMKMLHEEEGNQNVEMIRVPFTYGASEDGFTFTERELSGLRKLRYLDCSKANFSGNLKQMLPKLRWLAWRYCPPKFMRTGLCLRNMTILDLSQSDISEKWGGWIQIGVGSALKVLELRGCYKLRKTPDLSTYSSLERLILVGCRNLVEIHPSIGKLKGLKYLDVSYCDSLKGFPEELYSLYNLEVVLRHDNRSFLGSTQRAPRLKKRIGELTSLLIFQVHHMQIIKFPDCIPRLTRLRSLSLARCSGLEILPDTLADMKSLVELDLQVSDVAELPSTIGRLVKLERLSLRGCGNVKELPESIGNLESLVWLDLSKSAITELPYTIGNLKKLRVIKMDGSEIKELPTSIGMLKMLEELDASDSPLAEIPSTTEELSGLRVLKLVWTLVSQLPPKLPAGLIDIHISSPSLQRFPEFSNMSNLVKLCIEDEGTLGDSKSCQLQSCKLHGIGKLRGLVELRLKLCNVTCISEELTSLSRLQKLTLRCPNLQYLPPLPSNLSKLVLIGLEEKTQLPPFSNLKNLLTLKIEECCIPDGSILGNLGVGELVSLMHLSLKSCMFRNLNGLYLPENLLRLDIMRCQSLEALPALSHLEKLKDLSIFRAEKLVEIADIRRLKSLEALSVLSCGSLERLQNLSKLEMLNEITVRHCQKFKSINDTSEFKSLVRLSIKGCDCQDVETIFRRKTQAESRKRHVEDLDSGN